MNPLLNNRMTEYRSSCVVMSELRKQSNKTSSNEVRTFILGKNSSNIMESNLQKVLDTVFKK
jgi:hypothetical protein